MALVGGKNASLGEMYRELTPLGVRQANGFAITADAFRGAVSAAGAWKRLHAELGTGFADAVFVTGAWGTGENVVRGAVDPDEFYVHKPTFKSGARCCAGRSAARRSRWSTPAAPARR